MKTAVFVVAALVLAVMAVPAAAQDVETPKPLEVLGMGMAWIEPLDQDIDGYAAFDLSLQVFPMAQPEKLSIGTVPQYLAANLALDVLFTADDIEAGMSLPLYTIESTVPIRVGVGYGDSGWMAFIKGGVSL